MTDWKALAERFERFTYVPSDFGEAVAEFCRAMAEPEPVERDFAEYQPTFYCWQLQRAAIEDAMGRAPRGKLRTVNETDQLRGREGGLFIEVENHAHPIPIELRQLLAHDGWIMVRIDDGYARMKGRFARPRS